jgi:hypothetical protein
MYLNKIGCAVGNATFSIEEAKSMATEGIPIILVTA